MPQLLKNNHSIAQVTIAKSLIQRMKGLIGKTELKENQAFFIPYCSSVHTFFMKFPIDVIFTNKKFIVHKLCKNIPPGKILFTTFNGLHVFEMKAGQILAHQIKKGDKLYVEP